MAAMAPSRGTDAAGSQCGCLGRVGNDVSRDDADIGAMMEYAQGEAQSRN